MGIGKLARLPALPTHGGEESSLRTCACWIPSSQNPTTLPCENKTNCIHQIKIMYSSGWAMGRVRRSLNGSTAQFVRTNSQRSYQTTFYFETSQGKFSNPCWSEADIWRWFLLVWVTLRLLQRILAVTTWWRFVLRTSTAAIIPFLAMSSNALGTAYQHLHQSHPHPQLATLALPYMPCHLLCLGIACSGFGDVRRRGLVGTWALSLPVGYCPSEGFPASSNSQDWQQFLIPPFAFLAITMVCKASCSGHFASWF